MQYRQIRASFDENTLVVYQAYRQEIAHTALKSQRFVSPPFSMTRMTWIKPSFLWMMYRCGWATKPGQENVLAIRIKREGFEWVLKNAALSSFDSAVYASESEWKQRLAKTTNRVQWDPEKNIFLQPQDYKSIQVGIAGESVKRYVQDWIVSIRNISAFSREIHQLVQQGKADEAMKALPAEKPYPLPAEIARLIGADLS